MSARSDRVCQLLEAGKTCAEVASLTGESRAYISRIKRAQKVADLLLIMKAIGGESGAVELIGVPGKAGEPDAMLIAPAQRNSELDSLLKCLTTLPPE